MARTRWFEWGDKPADPGSRELPEAFVLLGHREMHTRTIVEWIVSNPQIRIRINEGLKGVRKGDRQSFIRMSLLQCLGTFHDPQGPLLELHVRLIEAAMSILDWDQIEHAFEE